MDEETELAIALSMSMMEQSSHHHATAQDLYPLNQQQEQKPKKKGRPRKKKVGEELDDNTRLAIAISASLAEETRQRNRKLGQDVDSEETGKNAKTKGKRRRRAVKKGQEFPVLLTRQDEERQNILSERINRIITQAVEGENSQHLQQHSRINLKYDSSQLNNAPLSESYPDCILIQAGLRLWQATGGVPAEALDAEHAFYVRQLESTIMPQERRMYHSPKKSPRKTPQKAVPRRNQSSLDQSQDATDHTLLDHTQALGRTIQCLADLAEEGVEDGAEEGEASYREESNGTLASGFIPLELEDARSASPTDGPTEDQLHLLEDLSSIVNTSTLSDVMIEIDDRSRLYAHTFMIQLRCSSLASVLAETAGRYDNKAPVIRVCNISYEAMESVLAYLYSAQINIDERTAIEIQDFAKRYDLPDLATHCEPFLQGVTESKTCRKDSQRSELDIVDKDLNQLIDSLWEDEQDDVKERDRNSDGDGASDSDGHTNCLNDDELSDIYEMTLTQRSQRGRNEGSTAPPLTVQLFQNKLQHGIEQGADLAGKIYACSESEDTIGVESGDTEGKCFSEDDDDDDPDEEVVTDSVLSQRDTASRTNGDDYSANMDQPGQDTLSSKKKVCRSVSTKTSQRFKGRDEDDGSDGDDSSVVIRDRELCRHENQGRGSSPRDDTGYHGDMEVEQVFVNDQGRVETSEEPMDIADDSTSQTSFHITSKNDDTTCDDKLSSATTSSDQSIDAQNWPKLGFRSNERTCNPSSRRNLSFSNHDRLPSNENLKLSETMSGSGRTKFLDRQTGHLMAKSRLETAIEKIRLRSSQSDIQNSFTASLPESLDISGAIGNDVGWYQPGSPKLVESDGEASHRESTTQDEDDEVVLLTCDSDQSCGDSPHLKIRECVHDEGKQLKKKSKKKKRVSEDTNEAVIDLSLDEDRDENSEGDPAETITPIKEKPLQTRCLSSERTKEKFSQLHHQCEEDNASTDERSIEKEHGHIDCRSICLDSSFSPRLVLHKIKIPEEQNCAETKDDLVATETSIDGFSNQVDGRGHGSPIEDTSTKEIDTSSCTVKQSEEIAVDGSPVSVHGTENVSVVGNSSDDIFSPSPTPSPKFGSIARASQLSQARAFSLSKDRPQISPEPKQRKQCGDVTKGTVVEDCEKQEPDVFSFVQSSWPVQSPSVENLDLSASVSALSVKQKPRRYSGKPLEASENTKMNRDDASRDVQEVWNTGDDISDFDSPGSQASSPLPQVFQESPLLPQTTTPPTPEDSSSKNLSPNASEEPMEERFAFDVEEGGTFDEFDRYCDFDTIEDNILPDDVQNKIQLEESCTLVADSILSGTGQENRKNEYSAGLEESFKEMPLEDSTSSESRKIENSNNNDSRGAGNQLAQDVMNVKNPADCSIDLTKEEEEMEKEEEDNTGRHGDLASSHVDGANDENISMPQEDNLASRRASQPQEEQQGGEDDFLSQGPAEFLDPYLLQELTSPNWSFNEGATPKTPRLHGGVAMGDEYYSPAPITPTPDFNSMLTPALKKELKKFGVKPLGKKKARLLLYEIFSYLHQVKPEDMSDNEETQTEPVPSKTKSQVGKAGRKKKPKQAAAQIDLTETDEPSTSKASGRGKTSKNSRVSKPGKRKTSEEQGKGDTPFKRARIGSNVASRRLEGTDGMVSKETASRRKASPADSDARDVEDHEMGPPEAGGSDALSCSQTSTESSYDSNRSDFGESICHEDGEDEDDIMMASQQVRDMATEVMTYIRSNKDLHHKILSYQVLNLEELYKELKEAKIRCSRVKLMDFLDTQCITFRHKEGPSRQRRQKTSKPKR